jgi:hypothetical protein
VTIAADNMDLATSFCDNEAGADARLRHAVHEAIAILRHGRRHGDPTALDEAARVMEKRGLQAERLLGRQQEVRR